MKRSFAVLLLIGIALSVPASANATLPSGENSVTGTGTTAGLYQDISVDAHTDASGANPTGTVAFTVLDLLSVSGPVTCLVVDGNAATIGFTDPMFGPLIVEVVDNGAAGTPPDTFLPVSNSTTCGAPSGIAGAPLRSGDFVVHHIPALTTKAQCRAGGWRTYDDPTGQPFKNEGACVRFVRHRS
jgi:hypothetical protein